MRRRRLSIDGLTGATSRHARGEPYVRSRRSPNPGSTAGPGSDLHFTISGSTFAYGAFLNEVIAFVSIAAAVFFFVVKPVNALMSRRKTEPDVESTSKECPECLSSIPVGARRCAFCTARVVA